jgi:hypothetical protein
MAENHMVRCTTKRAEGAPHERITHVGGTNSDGTQWKKTAGQIVAAIKSGEWKFYVDGGGKGIWLVVATHEGREYLTTESEGLVPLTLLGLPDCA